ncbi:Piso0_001427 [Millerozyma farinosa CBS 7064]|uniref:Piso0_001427 protein n=1 Tax=Pichia sorbitophila (strain ATCC MYA-4447 / BCRC 22081 / CBS 7064 / NBRC 10061 / NRRL Y-12695) TaxID=559304 RepID=G8YKR7_PICSO|nr:Piso0_001427 [Millerozyma farinosa CBS 7064]
MSSGVVCNVVGQRTETRTSERLRLQPSAWCSISVVSRPPPPACSQEIPERLVAAKKKWSANSARAEKKMSCTTIRGCCESRRAARKRRGECIDRSDSAQWKRVVGSHPQADSERQECRKSETYTPR